MDKSKADAKGTLAGLAIFSHGKESGPNGRKIRALRSLAEAAGWSTEAPSYEDLQDPDDRAARLVALAEGLRGGYAKLALVGSSMGGYASTKASAVLAPNGLFLMAPAFGLQGYKDPAPRSGAQTTFVVHGWVDDVVPAAASVRFAEAGKARLLLLDADHRLEGALADVSAYFEEFLKALAGQGGA